MNDITNNNTKNDNSRNNNTGENRNQKIEPEILVKEPPKLSTLLTAFRNLDKVCYRLGLLNKESSLFSDINWKAWDEKNDLPEALKRLDNTRDQIEQQIVKLKKMMSGRCLTILVWEFIVLFTLISGLLAGSYLAGYWVAGTFSPPWLDEFLSRPILITVSSLLLIAGFVILHYSLRDYYANKIANTVKKTETQFTLIKAFLLNSKFIHSIFRPEPIGLHWINRRRLQKAHDLYLSQTKNKS
ncbi:MAG: hypothetical protein ACC657_09685 [Thiohalomonadales bacterium]